MKTEIELPICLFPLRIRLIEPFSLVLFEIEIWPWKKSSVDCVFHSSHVFELNLHTAK